MDQVLDLIILSMKFWGVLEYVPVMLMTTFAPKCITRLISALSANGTAAWTAKEPGLFWWVAAKGCAWWAGCQLVCLAQACLMKNIGFLNSVKFDLSSLIWFDLIFCSECQLSTAPTCNIWECTGWRLCRSIVGLLHTSCSRICCCASLIYQCQMLWESCWYAWLCSRSCYSGSGWIPGHAQTWLLGCSGPEWSRSGRPSWVWSIRC